MKWNLRAALLFLLLSSGGIFCNGCTTLKAIRPAQPQPKSSLSVVEDHFKQVDAQIDATEEALQELLTCEEFEVPNAYASYALTAERMDLVANRLNQDLEAMHQMGLGYFREWDRQAGGYVNPQIRMLGKEHLTELSEDYLNIMEESRLAKRAFIPFRYDIQAIKEGLVDYATPIKVQYFSNIAEKARINAEWLKESVERVLTAIGQTRTQMVQLGISNGLKNGAPGGTPAMHRRMESPPEGTPAPLPKRMESPPPPQPNAEPNGTQRRMQPQVPSAPH